MGGASRLNYPNPKRKRGQSTRPPPRRPARRSTRTSEPTVGSAWLPRQVKTIVFNLRLALSHLMVLGRAAESVSAHDQRAGSGGGGSSAWAGEFGVVKLFQKLLVTADHRSE